MAADGGFPAARAGRVFVTEGGSETELMYKWGFELPHFAAYTLLENPHAIEVFEGLLARVLDVAETHDAAALLGGLDYRASPDWGALVGYDGPALRDANMRAIDVMREVGTQYEGRVADIRYAGYLGPRGDAYGTGDEITEDAAADYHAVQLATLAEAGVDLAWALTFNNIPEAVGATRAAQSLGMPLAISFTLNGEGRLASGPSLAEAVTQVDAQTGEGPAFFGINCSHPAEFAPALDDRGPWQRRLRSLRPNAAKMEKISLCRLGHLEEGDPETLAVEMGALAARMPWVDIWGGCCGTGEVHLDLILAGVRAAREGTAATPA